MLCLCLWWCMGVYVLATSIGLGAKRPCDASTGDECWCGMCMWLLTKIQLDQLLGRWRGGLRGHWWTPNLSCATSVPLQKRSTFSLWGWLNTSRGYPQRLWSHIQKLSGHGPGWPALVGPAWAGELDQMASRGLCQPQPFYDSEILYGVQVCI